MNVKKQHGPWRIAGLAAAVAGLAMIWPGWGRRDSPDQDAAIAALRKAQVLVTVDEPEKSAPGTPSPERTIGLDFVKAPADLELAATVPGVIRISVQAPVAEGSAQALSRIPTLTALDFWGHNIGERDWIRHLAGLRQFKTLFFSGVSLDDPDLSSLEKLTTLYDLNLSNCQITDGAMRQIARNRHLRCLEINRSQLDPASLRHLRTASSLFALIVRSCNIGDNALGCLAEFPALTTVGLSDNPISDHGLEMLSRIPKLKSLSLRRTKITTSGLKHLRGKDVSLSSWDVEGTTITKSDLVEEMLLRSVPRFIELLGDKSADTRTLAAGILGSLGPAAKSSVPALSELLQSKETSDRRAAVSALGKIGPEAQPAVPALEKALQDNDELVRKSAIEILKNIGKPPR